MDFTETVIVPTRLVLLGIVVGAFSGFMVAQLAPGPTMAAVTAKPPFSYGKALDTNLAKFNGRYFALGTEQGVSLNPNSVVQIRKIEYGQTRFVTIATTSSGVYSTDGLSSPNFRYPGIHVERVHLLVSPFTGSVLGWSRLTGWTKVPLLDAHSFGYLDSDLAPASQDGVCVTDNHTGACR